MAAHKEIEFRPWIDADEEQILALVRTNYGNIDPAYPEYFDWEYRRNPAGRAVMCCGILKDGRIVSVLAAVPVPVLLQGEALTAAVLVNGLTHPDFREKGIFPECGKAVCELMVRSGIAFSYGFPNPNSYPGLIRKVGYRDIGRARLLIRLYDPAALLSARVPALRRLKASGLGRAVVRSFARKPRQKTAVKNVPSFAGVSLAQLREKRGLVVDSARADWLNWRYVQVPRRDYHIAVVEGHSGLLGLAVYRICVWENVCIGTVNDLLLPEPAEQGAVESLMSHVFSQCETSGCAATFCVVSPASRKLKMLRRAGFWVMPPRLEPQPFPVILKEHTVPTGDITVADMNVSFGAYDVF